jgi:hypothetical protein
VTPPALKTLCDLVEQRTGYPVVVTADDDQTTSIKMRSASNGTQGTDTRNGYTMDTMGTGGGQTLFARPAF